MTIHIFMQTQQSPIYLLEHLLFSLESLITLFHHLHNFLLLSFFFPACTVLFIRQLSILSPKHIEPLRYGGKSFLFLASSSLRLWPGLVPLGPCFILFLGCLLATILGIPFIVLMILPRSYFFWGLSNHGGQ